VHRLHALALTALLAVPALADPVIFIQAAAGGGSNIVFDAVTEGTGTTSLSWTHTPTGTPRGVVGFCINTASAVDVFSGATYGGTAMTKIADADDSVTEPGFTEAYFLGASIPAGAQTMVCTVASGSESKWGVVFTVTADGDTQTAGAGFCVAESANGAGIDDPSCTIGSITGSSWAVAAAYSGLGAEGNISAGTGFSFSLTEDLGNFIGVSERRTTQLVGGDQIVGLVTSGADDIAMVAVALEEVP